MLLSTLGASSLGSLLSDKGIVRSDNGDNKRKRNCKSWLWKENGFLMTPHPLTNFEIQKYYQNEPRFNGIFSRDILSKKVKHGAYVINLDKYADTGTHWITLFYNKNEIVYFDSFGVEHKLNCSFSIILMLNMFLKNLKNSLGIRI